MVPITEEEKDPNVDYMSEEEKKALYQELRRKYCEAELWLKKYKEEKAKEIELGKIVRMAIKKQHAFSSGRGIWLVKTLNITYHKYNPDV